MNDRTQQKRISPYLKWAFAVFIGVLVPVYVSEYGVTNFLWISDITLFLTFFAILFENRLVASIAVLGGLFLELFWMVAFILVFFDFHLTSVADYMFDASLPLLTRALSLFHIFVPPLLIWFIIKFGYDRRAWVIQLVFSCLLLGFCWCFTEPSKNINWVYSYLELPAFGPFSYLSIELLTSASIISLTHVIFVRFVQRKRVFKEPLVSFKKK